MRTFWVFAPDKKYLENWRTMFLKTTCEELDMGSDIEEGLSTKQDEHDGAPPDAEEER